MKLRGFPGQRTRPSQRLRGLIGQGMARSVRSVTEVLRTSTLGSGTYTVQKSGYHRIYLWGAGGNSGGTLTTLAAGAGGGGATMMRVRLTRGAVVSYSLSSTAASAVTLANGRRMEAEKGATSSGAKPGSSGGYATGGDINRRGGDGGGMTDPDGNPETADGVPIPSSPGEQGGLGLSNTLGNGSGGGGASFLDDTFIAARFTAADFTSQFQGTPGPQTTVAAGAFGYAGEPGTAGGPPQILILREKA